MSGQGKRVFISYVREDKAAVDGLEDILTAAGVPVWRDIRDIAPGDEWKDKIRGAIADEVVLFMPCFSRNTAGRDRSTMNEEMHLAAEVYRKLPPGRNWFMPVRLDDVDLPNWQIAPGRFLSDINYTDLFGPQREKNLVALTTTLSRLLGQPSPDAATVSAAFTSSAPVDRVSLMCERTRELIVDPSKRIDLDTLVTGEIRAMLVALDDEEQAPLTLPRGDEEAACRAVVRATRTRVEAARPFCASLAVAARWGAAEDLLPWVEGIKALAAEATKAEGGTPSLLALRRLPVVMAIFAAAIGASRGGRLGNLKSLVGQPVVLDAHSRQRVTPLEACTPLEMYQEMPEAFQGLALRALTDGLDERSGADELRLERARQLFVVHELVYEALQPVLVQDYADAEHLADDFDRAEAFLSALQYDLGTQRLAEDPSLGRVYVRWVGRSAWRHRYTEPDIAAQLATEARMDGASWAPLQAGIFGGDLERALVGIQGFADRLHELRRTIF